MRIYLPLLCLAFSALSYGNDLISGYQWRKLPEPVIKMSSQNLKPPSEPLLQAKSGLSNEHNNKAVELHVKPNKANIDCKQAKNHC